LLSIPKPNGAWNIKFGDGRNADWLLRAAALVDNVQRAPINPTRAREEPSDLAQIRQLRPAEVVLKPWKQSDSEWLERLHGGLLGRICGCMLGKPVEAWFRRDIELLGRATGNWPITDYFRMPDVDEGHRLHELGGSRVLEPWKSAMLKGTMHGAVEDDDINYTTVGFAILKQFGKDFTPHDVAEFWCQNLPILHTCTAERVAYRNFVGNVLPPESATYRNPYREWIGAQIRADYFGYANPGNPERAAEWAWRDASISHIKNGIYGEMWVAAMLAAAYVEDDCRTIIRAGLAQIPAHCRLQADVDTILELHSGGATYDTAVEAVHARLDEKKGHHWCHTNSNAQIVTIGLLYGNDDYEQTISRAVMAGFDTDCNGATCGSLWGVKHGVSALPSKWTDPIADIVRTGVSGFYEVSVSQLSKDMLDTARRNGIQ
jgi:ADP-ribosylglycohydrolase